MLWLSSWTLWNHTFCIATLSASFPNHMIQSCSSESHFMEINRERLGLAMQMGALSNYFKHQLRACMTSHPQTIVRIGNLLVELLVSEYTQGVVYYRKKYLDQFNERKGSVCQSLRAFCIRCIIAFSLLHWFAIMQMEYCQRGKLT